MITNQSEIKSHEELIVDKGALCAELESANPFLHKQDFLLMDDQDTSQFDKNVCQLDLDTGSNELALKFFRDNLSKSLVRINRIPNNPELLNSVALNYLKIGELDKAIEGFETVLSKKKTYFPAIANLAECYVQKGELEEAIKIYKSYEIYFKDDIKYLNNISLLYFKTENIKKALLILEKAYRIDKKDTAVLNNLGIVNLSNKNPSKAIFYLRQALKINYRDHSLYNNLGVCFVFIKNLRKALTNFRISYLLNKSARNITHNLSNAYIELSEYESSISILSEYLESEPDDLEQRNKIAWCYFKLNLFRKCLNELKRSLEGINKEEKKFLASLYNNIAVVYDRLGNIPKARSYFIKGLKVYKKPDNIIIFNIIDFFFKYNKLDKAKSFIDLGLSMNPKNSTLLNYLGNYYLALSEYQLAKKYYEQAIEIDEKSLDACLGLSTIELDVLEDTDKALRILEKGIEYHPENISMINNYAYCLILRGDLSKAIRIIDGVDFRDSVHLTATLGLLCIKQGNLEEGRKYYNRAAQIAKNNKELRYLVLQKKELELSLYYLKDGNKKEALKRIKKGLAYKSTEGRYYNKLKEIYEKLAL